jgi:hypothetical protein
VIALAAPLYTTFARYPLPGELEVCAQCGPEWSAGDIRRTPLRALSLPQLEALHVMSLSDDHFRHFFPRLIELLLDETAPVFAFNLRSLRERVPTWPAVEQQAVSGLTDDLWQHLLARHPADLGYFSDGPTLIDFTYWSGQPLQPHLDRWSAVGTVAAAQHLGDVVDAAFTMREPFEPAVKEQVLGWLRQPIIGERLSSANLGGAEELWRVCGR